VTGSPVRAAVAIGGGVVAVVVVILLAAGVFSGGSSTKQPNHIGPAPTGVSAGTTATGGAKPAARSTVTVSVLNGTTVAGLARSAATKLQASGFKIGQVTNAADNARSATIVAYAPRHQAEALDVARIIGVGPDAVQPIDQGTRLIAGPDAVVVVTVGADQSR